MSKAIHTPRAMYRNHVTYNCSGIPCICQGLIHHTADEQRWNDKAKNGHHPKIVSLLKHDDWILFQVTHVNAFALDFNLWMLFDHQPAHVSEEKSPARVQNTMIPRLR